MCMKSCSMNLPQLRIELTAEATAGDIFVSVRCKLSLAFDKRASAGDASSQSIPTSFIAAIACLTTANASITPLEVSSVKPKAHATG